MKNLLLSIYPFARVIKHARGLVYISYHSHQMKRPDDDTLSNYIVTNYKSWTLWKFRKVPNKKQGKVLKLDEKKT